MERLNGISKELYEHVTGGICSDVLHSIGPAKMLYTDGSKSGENMGCAYNSGSECSAGFKLGDIICGRPLRSFILGSDEVLRDMYTYILQNRIRF